jgi:hypothetical protein
MAAPAAVQGLSTSDLEHIRDALASGRKPKVIFTEAAGQIAGQSGQVIQLTDPDVSEEWVVVRFGRDELPFSPGDLAVPPRGMAPRRPDARPEPKSEPKAAPEFKLGTVVPIQEKRVGPLPAPPSAPATAPATAASNGTATNGAAAKPGKAPKAPASLTVTLAYADREWTVSAQQGTKSLAKPYVIKPTEALQMVALLDVPGVHQAVENIIAAERAEAEVRAQRLRVELAEIESRLTELTNRG